MLVFQRPSYVRRFRVNLTNLLRNTEKVVAFVGLGMIPGLCIAFALRSDSDDSFPFFSTVMFGVLIGAVAIVVAPAVRAMSPPPTLRSVTFRESDLYMEPLHRAGYVAPWDWVLGAQETREGIWIDVMSFEAYLPGLRRDLKQSLLIARTRFAPEKFAWLRSRLQENGHPL
jgi:hypothetical protein